MYHLDHKITKIETGEYIQHYRNTEKFIVFCKQCKQYNSCWACPPYDFDMDEYISSYNLVYIIGTKISLDNDFRKERTGVQSCKDAAYQIIKEVRSNLDIKLLHLEKRYRNSKVFFAGTCHRCPENECTRKSGNQCIYPDDIRYSLESFGFDIGKTTSELLHIDLKWSENGYLPEYFTLVSGLFTPYEIHEAEILNTFLI